MTDAQVKISIDAYDVIASGFVVVSEISKEVRLHLNSTAGNRDLTIRFNYPAQTGSVLELKYSRTPGKQDGGLLIVDLNDGIVDLATDTDELVNLGKLGSRDLLLGLAITKVGIGAKSAATLGYTFMLGSEG